MWRNRTASRNGAASRPMDFSKEELLDWVCVWLRENGLPVANLVEGSMEEFRGKAFHADLASRFKDSGLD